MTTAGSQPPPAPATVILPALAPRPSGAAGWGVFFGMPFVWVVPFCILTALVGTFSGLILFGPAAILAPVATMALIYAVYRAAIDSRRRNGRVIVGYVETAVRLNLPLFDFLSAAWRSERGRCAAQLGTLCRMLHAGMPVGMALSHLPDVTPESAARIAAGESMGQLRQTLMRTRGENQQKDLEQVGNGEMAVYKVYPLLLLVFMNSVLLLVLIVVVPKFKEIFKDFRIPLPPRTQMLIGISSYLTDDIPGGGIVISVLLVAILGLIVSTWMTRIFTPNIMLPDILRTWQWLAWRLPIFHTLEINKGMSETCELLGSAIGQGAALPAALESAQLLEINPGFRRQVAEFRQGLLAGQPAGPAAWHAGLPPLLAGLLEAPATSNESQAAMFRFLARHYRQRFSRTTLLIRNAFIPAVVLAMGFLVGWVLLALFTPLVSLIQAVMPSDGGPL